MRATWTSLALLLAACAPAPLEVQLNFPTTQAFLHSNQAQLFVFPLDTSVDSDMDGAPDELGVCPELLADLGTCAATCRFTVGTVSFVPSFQTEYTDVCDFRAGMRLPEPAPGPHAYLVQVRAIDNSVIFTGCQVGEVFTGAEPILLELYPTDAYPAEAMRPVSGTPETRCAASTP
jgi:hypothetical protein